MIYRERFTIDNRGYGYQWHYTEDFEVAHGFGPTAEDCKEQIDEWIADGEEYMGYEEPDITPLNERAGQW